MYQSVNLKVHFPDVEEEILRFWNEHDIFRASVEKNDPANTFVMYDGPPFATGTPHFGNLVPSTVKDIIPRYKTMRGFRVERRFGWDCHGLPVEYEAEKELGISGKYDIERYGISEFNEYCRSIVLRYAERWRTVISRLGRWVDFDNDYKTMDAGYMQSIWWVFSRLWEKGLVYRGYYILPYSPELATPLSNFEVNLGGYRQVHDPAVTVKFAFAGGPAGGPQNKSATSDKANKTFFLAWTTTPWTLLSNQGLGMHPDIIYATIDDAASGERYIMAESRLAHYYKDAAEYTVVSRAKGSEFAGCRYEPLFPYFADIAEAGGFLVHTADFVSDEDGTGIVHLAGGFGEDDHNVVCKKAGLPVICPVDDECKFTDAVGEFAGLFVKDADKPIIAKLKAHGMLVRRENYLHNYPFCYRTNKPLIYRAVQSWFVNVEKIKQTMLDSNATVNWMPSHLRDGRFGNWLENARDWAISRNRFWGNPIPVWTNEDGSQTEVIGSIAELEKKSGRTITDLHKHIIDDITWTAEDGSLMRRVPQVLDCWFESGAMPYGQSLYPFKDKQAFEERFPADFISEGLDQTRGWFYTLTVLSAALFEAPAFKNVVVNGLVLAEDGRKMSKSEKNFTDPMHVLNTFGADALRLFLMNSAVLKAEDVKYSDESVREELKNYILPLWSAYGFFVTYASIDGVYLSEQDDLSMSADPVGGAAAVTALANPLDRWILSELRALIDEVGARYEAYDIFHALARLKEFLDLLNNWYIRRSRRRFWKSANDADKQQGYATLFTVLSQFTKLTAPITPFIAEAMYRNINAKSIAEGAAPASVHLCDFPSGGALARDGELEYKMRAVRSAVTLGRAIRSLYEIKNRQPLAAAYFFTRAEAERSALLEMADIIKEELNVKEVIFRQNEEELITYSAKPNYRSLGKTLGKSMQRAAAVIAELTPAQIKALLDGQSISVDIDGAAVALSAESVIVERAAKENLKVLNEGTLTAALDTELTPALAQEGKARDMVRALQSLRKESGLEATDRISLVFYAISDSLREALARFEDYIQGETLAVSVRYEDAPPAEGSLYASSGSERVAVGITKVAGASDKKNQERGIHEEFDEL